MSMDVEVWQEKKKYTGIWVLICSWCNQSINKVLLGRFTKRNNFHFKVLDIFRTASPFSRVKINTQSTRILICTLKDGLPKFILSCDTLHCYVELKLKL